jgi:hypothetical protein
MTIFKNRIIKKQFSSETEITGVRKRKKIYGLGPRVTLGPQVFRHTIALSICMRKRKK